jgi:hypothetical protein
VKVPSIGKSDKLPKIAPDRRLTEAFSHFHTIVYDYIHMNADINDIRLPYEKDSE